MSSNAQRVAARRRFFADKSIEYMGGKCQRCGWKEHTAGLAWHHVDPSKKEFSRSAGYTRRWSDLKVEMDKCVLLCHNCHSVVHVLKESKWFDESIIPERKDVEGITSNQIRKQTHCIDCETEIGFGSKRCRSCAGRVNSRVKIEWPEPEVLLTMVADQGYVGAGRTLGVSDNAVRNRIRKNKLHA